MAARHQPSVAPLRLLRSRPWRTPLYDEAESSRWRGRMDLLWLPPQLRSGLRQPHHSLADVSAIRRPPLVQCRYRRLSVSHGCPHRAPDGAAVATAGRRHLFSYRNLVFRCLELRLPGLLPQASATVLLHDRLRARHEDLQRMGRSVPRRGVGR